jgi:hypothetical protein
MSSPIFGHPDAAHAQHTQTPQEDTAARASQVPFNLQTSEADYVSKVLNWVKH